MERPFAYMARTSLRHWRTARVEKSTLQGREPAAGSENARTCCTSSVFCGGCRWKRARPWRTTVRVEVCRGRAGGGAGEGAPLLLPSGRWAGWIRLRERSRSRGRCCTRRTSRVLRSWSHGSEHTYGEDRTSSCGIPPRARTGPIPPPTQRVRKRLVVPAMGLPNAYGVSCRVRAERLPYASTPVAGSLRDSPQPRVARRSVPPSCRDS